MEDEDLQSRLARIAEIVPSLNSAADEATKIIKEVDSLLSKLNVGISAEVAFREETDDPSLDGYDSDRPFYTRYLAYARVGREYSIHVHSVAHNKDGYDCADNEMTLSRDPWSSCPREWKLEAIAVLPQLLDEIVSKAEALRDKAVAASAKSRKMLDSKK